MNPLSKLILTALLLSLRLLAASNSATPPAEEVFRIGISHGSLGPVNRNDASAALKVWVVTVTQERRLGTPVQVSVFENSVQLSAAMARGELQAASMTTEELVRSGQRPESIFLAAKEDGWGEHYVLVAQKGGPVQGLTSLAKRSLVHHKSLATSVALPWLDSELSTRDCPPSNTFLREIHESETPSKTVLRVFFGQSDACLITSNAFNLSCELNPQIRQKLQVVASSPKLVPSVLFFRSDWNSALRAQLESAILQIHNSSSGRQVLTIFQSSRMEKQPFSCLERTWALFDPHGSKAQSPPSAVQTEALQ